MRLPPVAVHVRVAVPDEIDDNHPFASGASAAAAQFFEKLPTDNGVEPVRFPAKEEPTVAKTDNAKVAHALAGGMIRQDRTAGLERIHMRQAEPYC